MRAFVGIPVPEPWAGPLVRVQERLALGRRVAEDDLHLTLAFLDERPEAALEALAEEISARPLRAAPLRPVGVAPFGDGGTVALDVATDPALVALHDTVRLAARGAGIDLPRRRFRPHVTLARLGRGARDRLPGALSGLGHVELPEVRAEAITLWSSTLTPDGPIYEPIETWPLIG